MKKNFAVSILVVTGLLGYLMVPLIGLEAQQQEEEQLANNRSSDLVEVITRQEEEIEQLESEIEQIQSQIDANRDLLTEEVGRLSTLRTSLENNRHVAGLTPVEGPGMIITLNDNTALAESLRRSQGDNFNPNDFIIHDKTLLYLVNDLKTARPQAISINDQRIVTQTNIRCVGTVILVNDTRLSPPYEIQLVGDPDRLELALEQSSEYQLLQSQEFPVSYELAETIEIPRYRGNLRLNQTELYQPLPDEETSQEQTPMFSNEGIPGGEEE